MDKVHRTTFVVGLVMAALILFPLAVMADTEQNVEATLTLAAVIDITADDLYAEGELTQEGHLDIWNMDAVGCVALGYVDVDVITLTDFDVAIKSGSYEERWYNQSNVDKGVLTTGALKINDTADCASAVYVDTYPSVSAYFSGVNNIASAGESVRFYLFVDASKLSGIDFVLNDYIVFRFVLQVTDPTL